jgi:hypothetical protein
MIDHPERQKRKPAENQDQEASKKVITRRVQKVEEHLRGKR